MKKVVKILLPFIIASSAVFSGCKKKNKNKEDNRVLLSFGDMHATEATEIDIFDLAEITKNKESFLFVVTTDSCSCWTEFESVLNRYLSDNKMVCYRMDFESFKDVAIKYGLTTVAKSTTTFAIFENGVLKTSIDSADNSNIMGSLSKFSQYMDETIIKPSCYFITRDDIDTIKASDKSAVIYFERSGCGDCNALNPGLLREYVKNHPNMNKLYTFDAQSYWRRASDSDYQDYLDFKKDVGLADETNPTYGYGSGVFPFFSYIENGQYASGSVIYNDRVTEEDGKHVITTSYYTTERVEHLQYTNKVIQGLELSAEDLDEDGKWTIESKDNLYKDILTSFLDYALTKQTFNF